MKNAYTYGLIFALLVFLAFSCATQKEAVEPIPDETMALRDMMTGSYDSSNQESQDSSYYNISLHMYPIWENRKDGRYLYVEQALASMQDRPYRQRVYRLQQQEDGTLASYVYTIKHDSLFIGKWKTPGYFDKYGLTLLDEREGCEVILEKTDVGYQGSTVADHCKSSLRGAAFATSKVSMTTDRITSWDQGFDSDGKQVWGATKGPYIFDKVKD